MFSPKIKDSRYMTANQGRAVVLVLKRPYRLALEQYAVVYVSVRVAYTPRRLPTLRINCKQNYIVFSNTFLG